MNSRSEWNSTEEAALRREVEEDCCGVVPSCLGPGIVCGAAIWLAILGLIGWAVWG